MPDTMNQAVTGLTDKLQQDTARARVANARLIADEQKAWSRYAHAVAEVLEQLERDLEDGKATLEAQRIARAAERKATIQPAVDRARGSLDELRVQADLLAMETRNPIGPAREAALNAMTDVRGTVERLSEAICRHQDDTGAASGQQP